MLSLQRGHRDPGVGLGVDTFSHESDVEHNWHQISAMMLPQPASCPPSDYDERGHLHDAFTQMTLALQEVAAAQGECFMEFGFCFPHLLPSLAPDYVEA